MRKGRNKTRKYIVRKMKRKSRKINRQRGASKAGPSTSKAGTSTSKAGPSTSKAGPSPSPMLSVIYAKLGNYNNPPQISVEPVEPNMKYLVTMIDLNAPAGLWTHYVLLINDDKKYTELYKYKPPSPPKGSGAHNYVFNTYALNKTVDTSILVSKQEGHDYYVNVLEPFLQGKKKIGNEVKIVVEG